SRWFATASTRPPIRRGLSALSPGCSERCSVQRGKSPRRVEPVDDLLQNLVRLRAHDQVAPAEYVRGYRVDAHGRGKPPVLSDDVCVVVNFDRAPLLNRVKTDGGTDRNNDFY